MTDLGACVKIQIPHAKKTDANEMTTVRFIFNSQYHKLLNENQSKNLHQTLLKKSR